MFGCKRSILWTAGVLLVCGAGPAFAATTLKEVVVRGRNDTAAGVSFLPSTEGTRIYSGKKTSVIDLDAAPQITNNNFRQVFEKTPGLLISEESTPLFSVGYRGLDPHRAQFTQVLKDGVPIHADMFGYPEAYYVPPTQVVERIDFIRGGGSLMYGPQPGGALNFVTRDPYDGAPFTLHEENSMGSHGLYSNYTSLSGTQGSTGYYGYGHHRQGQGFRDHNSQFELWYGGGKLVHAPDDQTRWTATGDYYTETHGEPGGLTRAVFDRDLTVSNKLADLFELNRYSASLGLERELDERTEAELKGYYIRYERLSWRQRGGGFGTVPTGAAAATNDIEEQIFDTFGVEGRLRRDYSAFGSDEHAFSVGSLYHHTDSPRLDSRGTTADAQAGTLRKDSDRELDYVSVFMENLFRFGPLSVTPGVRLENIWQSIRENLNADKTTVPLADKSVHDFVALGGVGAAYDIGHQSELYGNFSQSYRPMVFTQAVPNGTNQVVNDDLQEGRSWQIDGGLRGKPRPYVSFDATYFYMEFDDQVGSVSIGGLSSVGNVGDARHQGAELAAELDVIGWTDEALGARNADAVGALSVFFSAMFLDAEFTGGPNTGKTPQYAPDFIMKGGVEWNCLDKGKVRLAGTFTDDHFANDNNTAQFAVPSYKVWDLTAELNVYRDIVTVFGGVNNLFDERYFARVRSDGIDPADGRNYTGGVTVRWG